MAFITTPLASLLSPRSSFTSAQSRPASFRISRNLRVSPPTVTHPTMSATEVDVGSPAIDFTLQADGGRTVSLSQLTTDNKTLIFYFYPKDATSGCTTEAKDFRDLLPQFAEIDAQVIGVSKDSVESHDAFAKDLSLTFPLISDDGTLSEGYGVWKLRKMFGKEFMGIERSTFIIQDGVIVKVWRGVKAPGHAEDVLNAVKQL